MVLKRNQDAVWLIIVMLVAAVTFGSGCQSGGTTTQPGSATSPTAGTTTSAAPGATHHVGSENLYPRKDLTPGAVFPNVTAETVCQPGYSKSVRNVSQQEKREVFQRYNIPWEEHSKYEVDHFVSLELGGSNDVENLWPEPYEPRPGAHEKDEVENYLHKQVCDGNMTLEEAQKEIREDWYKVYTEKVQGQGHHHMRHSMGGD